MQRLKGCYFGHPNPRFLSETKNLKAPHGLRCICLSNLKVNKMIRVRNVKAQSESSNQVKSAAIEVKMKMLQSYPLHTDAVM